MPELLCKQAEALGSHTDCELPLSTGTCPLHPQSNKTPPTQSPGWSTQPTSEQPFWARKPNAQTQAVLLLAMLQSWILPPGNVTIWCLARIWMAPLGQLSAQPAQPTPLIQALVHLVIRWTGHGPDLSS